MPDQAVFVFAGPSLFGTGLSTADGGEVTWLPPARRGDVEALTSKEPPGVIGLADGTFHSYPSIGHVELRDALEMGWRVYGLCSMGAIRAAEMAHMGMIPYGAVAEAFCADPNMPDDEVALVHSAETPFFPISEPMVHIRAFMRAMVDSSAVSPEIAAEVIESMVDRWYGDRTLTALASVLVKALGTSALPSGARQALTRFDAYRTKQADLTAFISNRPWSSINN